MKGAAPLGRLAAWPILYDTSKGCQKRVADLNGSRVSLDVDAGLSISKGDSLPLAVLMRDIVGCDAGVDRAAKGPEVMDNELPASLG